MLALLAGTGDDQYHDSNDVGKHLDKLLHTSRKTGNVNARDVKTAENVGAEDSGAGFPQCEDNDSDSEPSAVAETVVGPGAGGVVHDEVKTAKSRNSSADAGGKILIKGDVDAGSVGSCGIFADSAEVKTYARVLEEPLRQNGNDNGNINQKSEGEEGLAYDSEMIGEEGNLGLVCVTRGEKGDRAAFAEEFEKGAAVEVSETDTECGQRKTDNVLICLQRNGEEAVYESDEGGSQNRCKK